MKVLILVAGDQRRWRDEEGNYTHGVPKQLVAVDGEPLLHRTVRLLRERGITDITIVHKSGESSLFRVAGAKMAVAKLKKRNFQADRFFSSRHLWSDVDRTVLLYGDVYFTEPAIDAIVADRSGWWAYGRPGPSKITGCLHGELFGWSWTPDAHGYVEEHMRRIVDLHARGVITRSIGWELYRSMMGAEGAQVRTARIRPDRMVVIDDWTEDMDKPEKFDLWLRRRAGLTTPASLVVPARLDGQRRRLWEFLRPRWEALGIEIVECDAPTKVWSKGAAVAAGVKRASHDVLVVADADVWCGGVPEAIDRVQAGVPWAIPHYLVKRLTRPATEEVFRVGWPRKPTTTTYAERPYPGRPGGGIVVLTRDAYRKVPIDPRFVNWGQEDESWALALGTLLGRSWRGTADLWHLWHDPAPRQSRAIGSQDSLTMLRRYTAAHRNRAKMQAIVDEYAGSLA